MIGRKRSQSTGSAFVVAAFVSALWLVGLSALALVPAATGSSDDDVRAVYRHQATGTTYAYQDATGEFTVYVRGSWRTPYYESSGAEG